MAVLAAMRLTAREELGAGEATAPAVRVRLAGRLGPGLLSLSASWRRLIAPKVQNHHEDKRKGDSMKTPHVPPDGSALSGVAQLCTAVLDA